MTQSPPNPYHQPYGGAPASSKSKIVAGVLGILLGGLGIHNFYLGRTTRGIVQLVLTVLSFGIGHIWGFIEGILILISKPGTTWHQDAAGRELQD
ncbi:MAG TPA: TM2 domain-containing protein [Arachnia sp.]|nr:TM2 domain-containing protein [Arachnia sp.]HMT86151.1 TM2 domain-containing protein [Arachnia sp.]